MDAESRVGSPAVESKVETYVVYTNVRLVFLLQGNMAHFSGFADRRKGQN